MERVRPLEALQPVLTHVPICVFMATWLQAGYFFLLAVTVLCIRIPAILQQMLWPLCPTPSIVYLCRLLSMDTMTVPECLWP